MRTGAKLGAYGAVLAIVLGGGAAVGAASGPIDVGGADHEENRAHATDQATEATDQTTDDGAVVAGSPATDLPGGLAIAEGGYRLDLETDGQALTTPSELRFRVVDAGGEPVTDYEEEHERDLHLIVVGRDLAGYAHLHPELDARGTWAVDLPALGAGSYRAFADFRPTGGDEALTLGVDLTVAGAASATPVPPPATTDTIDGYEVALAGEPTVGESELTFTVRLDDETVRTDPYLGAAAHLVAIRAGDLAYLHVHPLDAPGDEVAFAAEFPSAGTYRLFLDFSHAGEVRTAAFTVEVGNGQATVGGDHDDQEEGH